MAEPSDEVVSKVLPGYTKVDTEENSAYLLNPNATLKSIEAELAIKRRQEKIFNEMLEEFKWKTRMKKYKQLGVTSEDLRALIKCRTPVLTHEFLKCKDPVYLTPKLTSSFKLEQALTFNTIRDPKTYTWERDVFNQVLGDFKNNAKGKLADAPLKVPVSNITMRFMTSWLTSSYLLNVARSDTKTSTKKTDYTIRPIHANNLKMLDVYQLDFLWKSTGIVPFNRYCEMQEQAGIPRHRLQKSYYFLVKPVLLRILVELNLCKFKPPEAKGETPTIFLLKVVTILVNGFSEADIVEADKDTTNPIDFYEELGDYCRSQVKQPCQQ